MKKLALVLCLALLSLNYSNAEVVTVPIGNGLSVTVTTGNDVPALQNINTNAAATQVHLGDDGNTSVPLQFQYSLFGQTFNTSWMHSNGVVSFQNPNVTSNFCCSGANLTTTTNSAFNYSIMPMWTDLYGRTGQNTYYLSTPDSITYGWYGTSQYSNQNNKSSFEVSLNSSGVLDMRWAGAIVNATTTIGFTGDLSKGQYYQYYHGNNVVVNGLSVSFMGAGAPPTPPIVAPTQITSATPRTQTVLTPIPETPTSSVIVNVGGVEMTTTGTIGAPNNIPQTVRDSIASSSLADPIATPAENISSSITRDTTKEESKSGAPMSLIMSTISKIQENDKATQRAAVQNAAQQVSLSMSKSQEQAAAVVSSLNSMSAASSQASMQTTNNTQSQQSTLSLNLPTVQQTTQTNSTFNSVSSPQTQQQNYASQNQNTQIEVPIVSVNSTTSRTNPLTELMESKLQLDNSMTETKAETVNKNVQSNELAGGVDIAMMALQPKGYESYSFTMKDASFYEPKEIYNKQNNVDNIKVLRQLSSDRLHQEMVDQQYKGK